MLVQPDDSLTDLVLGAAVVMLALLLRSRQPGRAWMAAFWWTGIAALAGAVHHGFIAKGPGEAVSWALVSSMVVVAISYLLAASVTEVLGAGHRKVFWTLRGIGFLAYAVVAVTGHASISAILYCESLSMLSIIGLWLLAARRRHPMAAGVLIAFGANALAGITQALSPRVTELIGLQPTPLYHLAQIVGMVLLFLVLRRHAPATRTATTDPDTSAATV